MVLGWKDGENKVIKEILNRIATLESKVKLLESENAAQKEEILKLRNGNACTEWRDVLIGKKKKLSENQRTIVNAVETERIDRDNRGKNVVLFGVPTSTALSDEEREREDETTAYEILKEIGMEDKKVYPIEKIKRFKANPNRTAVAKPLPVRITFTFEEDALNKSKSAKGFFQVK